jgi:hypothetical protein
VLPILFVRKCITVFDIAVHYLEFIPGHVSLQTPRDLESEEPPGADHDATPLPLATGLHLLFRHIIVPCHAN